MTKFQNLKIAITDNDHLKAVCDVLESMRYECGNPYFFNIENLIDGWVKSIAAYTTGSYFLHKNLDAEDIFNCDEVQLADLLKMRDEMVKHNAKSSQE